MAMFDWYRRRFEQRFRHSDETEDFNLSYPKMVQIQDAQERREREARKRILDALALEEVMQDPALWNQPQPDPPPRPPDDEIATAADLERWGWAELIVDDFERSDTPMGPRWNVNIDPSDPELAAPEPGFCYRRTFSSRYGYGDVGRHWSGLAREAVLAPRHRWDMDPFSFNTEQRRMVRHHDASNPFSEFSDTWELV
jgi:hypothetical protein